MFKAIGVAIKDIAGLTGLVPSLFWVIVYFFADESSDKAIRDKAIKSL